MKIADLKAIDVRTSGSIFTYALSVPHRVRDIWTTNQVDELVVYSYPDYTKVATTMHRELIKTLGVASHANVLQQLGYIQKVNSGWVQALTDEELLTCLYEFEKTGDDTHPFRWELANR